MKLLILSDSHGDIFSMEKIVVREAPDIVLHLGDYVRDGKALACRYPQLEIVQVSGNCDLYDRHFSEPLERVFCAGGVSFYLCHGHIHFAGGEQQLAKAAKNAGCTVCLFGHTHIPLLTQCNGISLLNPGSCGASLRHEYAVVEIGGSPVFSLREL